MNTMNFQKDSINVINTLNTKLQDINTTNIKNDSIKNNNRKPKSKSKRCFLDNCNKKIKLTDIECKCEHTFCTLHRLPEQHLCSFDWNTYGKNILKAKLNKVENQKLNKI